MRAVITIIGKDQVGIFAAATEQIAKANANIEEVSQSILNEYFAMIMVADIDNMNIGIDELKKNLEDSLSTMQVHVMHEDIFNAMHRI